MPALAIEELAGGIKIVVKVVPASSKTALAGKLNDMLKVKVAAPPEKGKANECLTDFLAKFLGVKKNAVSVISGLTSPTKHIYIEAITKEQFLQRIE